MPEIYIKKELYDKIKKLGKDPSKFINKILEEHMKLEKVLNEAHEKGLRRD